MQVKNLISAGLATGLMVMAGAALAQPGEGYGYHPMWGGDGWGWGGMIMGPLMFIIVIAVIAVVVIGVARMAGCTGGRCGHHHGSSSALAVLEERFAKGEIDKAEFEERKNALKS